jgi:hypothetical protein
VREARQAITATFRASLDAPGSYRVLARVPHDDAATRAATYRISTTSGVVERTIDQLARGDAWVKLGVFDLADARVRLSSWTGEPRSSGRRVISDAVRFVPLDGSFDAIPLGKVVVSDGVQGVTGAAPEGDVRLVFSSPGLHQVVATYAGDDEFDGSMSAPFDQHVSKAPTAARIQATVPNPSEVGLPVTVTFFVFGVPGCNPTDVTPTGTLTVTDGVDSCTESVRWEAGGAVVWQECSLRLTTPGTRSVVAKYPGDDFFLPSTSEPVSQQVDSP